MKHILITALAFLLASCACNSEKEEYVPYPGGKACQEEPNN